MKDQSDDPSHPEHTCSYQVYSMKAINGHNYTDICNGESERAL